MNEYIGKTCPFCKTPFQEGDDIVICSVCEMPHHKECWVENRQCTTFGCTGTIQGVSAKNSGLAFCNKCGTPHNVGDAFCGVCGNNLTGAAPVQRTVTPPQQTTVPLYQTQQTAAPVQQTFRQTQQTAAPVYQTQQTYTPPPVQPAAPGPFDALIVEKIDFYNSKFREMDAKNTKTSWNWAAFLIAPLWCIYRKMYVHAAALFIASSLLGLMGWIGSIVSLVGYAVFGVYANHLYRDYLIKVSDFAAHVSEPAKSKYLSARTGADMNKAALISVICMLISALLGL